MLDCLIIGDSIAVGTAMYRPECVSYSRGGWNSWQWNRDYLSISASKPTKTLIISLGANDHQGIKTEQELRKMRSAITADRVFWISPGKERKPIPQDAIERIAQEYGDVVLPRPKDHMSSDGVHPTGTGYKILGQQAK
jgi:lysophospholipase L1-like esterase